MFSQNDSDRSDTLHSSDTSDYTSDPTSNRHHSHSRTFTSSDVDINVNSVKCKKILQKQQPRNKHQAPPDVKNITSSEKELVVKKEIIDYRYQTAEQTISNVKEEFASDVCMKEEQTDFLDNAEAIDVNCHVGKNTSDLVVTAKISPPMIGNNIKMINSENKDKSKDIDVVIISDSSSDNMSIKQETQMSKTQLSKNQSE